MAQDPPPSVRFSRGPCSIGTALKTGAPTLAEALGYTDLDFLVVDTQHAALGIETVAALIRAVPASLDVLVRVPKTQPGRMTAVLDAGAAGIVVPQVESVADLSSVVGAMFYESGRSFSPMTRAGQYGHRAATPTDVDDSLALLPQIESAAGVRNAAAIARHERVTGLTIGPTDLALSVGESAVAASLAEVHSTAREVGCGIGTFVGDFDELAGYDAELTFAIVGSDVGHLTAVFADLTDLRRAGE